MEERENNSVPVNVTNYKSIVGALLFFSTKIRPDISFVNDIKIFKNLQKKNPFITMEVKI